MPYDIAVSRKKYVISETYKQLSYEHMFSSSVNNVNRTGNNISIWTVSSIEACVARGKMQSGLT